MSVYPPKKSKQKSFLSNVRPDFIEPPANQDQITAIRQLRQASNAIVKELWEAGRDFVNCVFCLMTGSK